MFGPSKTQPEINEDLDDEAEEEAVRAGQEAFKGRVHSALCFVLAGGNIGFGLLASLQPARLTGIMQEDEGRVRAIGARDLASGMALLAAKDKRWPLLLSIRTDVFEAMGWIRTKPRLAIVPLTWAGMAALALLTRPSKPRG